MAADLEITVLDRQRSRRVDCRTLGTFLDRAATVVGPEEPSVMTICLVSDRRMRELNGRYRKQDVATDVLSFLGESAPEPDGLRQLGDVVIAVPCAARQAREQRHSLTRELKILALHGYLHLLGYDHETDNGQMMRLQRKLERRLLRPLTRARSKRAGNRGSGPK